MVEPQDTATVRAQLLRTVLLSRAIAEESGPIEITVRSGATELRFTLERPAADNNHSLPTIEQRLLAVATAEPMKPAAFARLTGYKPGDHIRKALTSLARKGLLQKAVGGGYMRG